MSQIANSKSQIANRNKRYFPQDIEEKWRKKWQEAGLYKNKNFRHSERSKRVEAPPRSGKYSWGESTSSDNSVKTDLSTRSPEATSVGMTDKNYYVLVELPYPSGDLHIGHWFTFISPDVLSRFLKMNGKDVFFPMGFDAFGLPAENAAIKRGIHPKDWTLKNIETMTKQFSTMGTMIDWDSLTVTCLPEYYRWNQWIFLKMYEKGLAYRGKMLSNWCPVDQTVLANEHVVAGKCWRCGSVVEQKEVEQWFLKITDYAEKLLWPEFNSEGHGPEFKSKGIDNKIENKKEEKLDPSSLIINHFGDIDWPISVKTAQNDWIGKKVGMKIQHKVVEMDLAFETFTAFPAWSWADTYIVIAPEHPLVKDLVKDTEYEKNVMEFVLQMSKESELERKETTEKKGIFTGRYAKDPFGGADMPIWLANFALMNFGTGIIRCSAHDPRDVAFAKKYNIPVKQVVEGVNDVPANAHDNKGILKNSGPFTGREVSTVLKEVMDWIEKQGIGKRYVNYHLHDWSVSRQRYWGTPVPFIYCDKCMEKSKIKNQTMVLQGKSKMEYGRDYITIGNKDYAMIPVPYDQLPVELPYNVDYAPKGKPPLASNEEWLAVKCPKCQGKAERDPETLDTFFDSSWYYYRYVDPKYTQGPFDKLKVKNLMPVDVYFGGGEHTLGHTLYARFFTKFFKDLGLVDFSEFAKKRIQHGIVLGPDGNKMSKSKGNVINPDEVVKEFGTDAVRVYLSFMMPYEATGPWSTEAMHGAFRFLKRIWELQYRIKNYSPRCEAGELSHGLNSKIMNREEAKGTKDTEGTNVLLENKQEDTYSVITSEDLYQMHTTIAKVTQDIESIHLNTAIAALMEWLNYLSRKEYVLQEEYKTLLLLLSPFAPHITEELWLSVIPSEVSPKAGKSRDPLTTEKEIHRLWTKNDKWSVHQQSWPVSDKKYLVANNVTIAVQINGRLRGSFSATQEDIKSQKFIEEIAKKDEKTTKYLEGKIIKKIIYVPGKLINFVAA